MTSLTRPRPGTHTCRSRASQVLRRCEMKNVAFDASERPSTAPSAEGELKAQSGPSAPRSPDRPGRMTGSIGGSSPPRPASPTPEHIRGSERWNQEERPRPHPRTPSPGFSFSIFFSVAAAWTVEGRLWLSGHKRVAACQEGPSTKRGAFDVTVHPGDATATRRARLCGHGERVSKVCFRQ